MFKGHLDVFLKNNGTVMPEVSDTLDWLKTNSASLL